MKHIDIEHNTEDWFYARAGLATTSSFDKILTPTGKKSAQQDNYACKIVAETLLGKPIENQFDSYQLQWGRQYEDHAKKLYSFDLDVEIQSGGFFINDDLTLGSSPDLRVYKDDTMIACAEIKCPVDAGKHIYNLSQHRIDKKYLPQIFGQMIVCNVDRVDFFSYYPELPENIITVMKDDNRKYYELLKEALEEFIHDKVNPIFKHLLERDKIREIPTKPVARFFDSKR